MKVCLSMVFKVSFVLFDQGELYLTGLKRMKIVMREGKIFFREHMKIQFLFKGLSKKIFYHCWFFLPHREVLLASPYF